MNKLPLLSGDFYLESYHRLLEMSRGDHIDQQFTRFSKAFNWSDQYDSSVLNFEEYQAFVLTDPSYKLLWVDQGFSDMTGYHSHDVIGKKPNMLHGQNTKDSERKLFRSLLASNEVFTTRITNHKKSGQAYICEVKIVPLFNQNNELSHYIALEREIAA